MSEPTNSAPQTTGNVVDVTADLKMRKAQEQFARLWGLVERQERDLQANPKPFLDRATAEIVRCHATLEAVYKAIHPPVFRDRGSPPNFDIRADAMRRLDRASEILGRHLYGSNNA